MRKKEQLELTRHNVTPAQFLAYVRHQIRKHNFTSILADDINFEYWKNGGDLEFDYHDVVGKPCKAEKSVSQPYKMQTYILNWDGTVYNLIAEFEFDDDKRGWGYFYFVNTWDIEEPEEPEKVAAVVEKTVHGYTVEQYIVGAFDTPIALIDRHLNFCSWVVAWNYDKDTDTWGQGHYFDDKTAAVAYFKTYMN